jgi:DNA-binding transcriptional regulator YhcF (GntR family)
MPDISAELDRQNYKPLYIQLSEILIDYANAHQLENGDALPSENELLAQFSVSRNTIRLAVDRLVQVGVAKKLIISIITKYYLFFALLFMQLRGSVNLCFIRRLC